MCADLSDCGGWSASGVASGTLTADCSSNLHPGNETDALGVIKAAPSLGAPIKSGLLLFLQH